MSPSFPIVPSVWAVRVDFRPLGMGSHPAPSPAAPRAPRALRIALEGVRELRAEPDGETWELFRDGLPIGRVSRPAPVPLRELLSRPGSAPLGAAGTAREHLGRESGPRAGLPRPAALPREPR